MKSSLLSGGLLLLLLVAVLLNTLLLGQLITDTRREVVMLTPQDSAATVDAVYRRFQQKERLISLTVSHEDLMSAEAAFAELRGAAEARDEKNFLIIKSRLCDVLSHLRRLSGINLDTIL